MRIRTTTNAGVLAVLLVLMAGCASLEQRRGNFQRDQERCVGQKMGSLNPRCVMSLPLDIVPVDDSHDAYRYTYHDCRWEFTVNRQTKIIEKLSYLSPREACYYHAFDPPL
jgi:hypothetical protein